MNQLRFVAHTITVTKVTALFGSIAPLMSLKAVARSVTLLIVCSLRDTICCQCRYQMLAQDRFSEVDCMVQLWCLSSAQCMKVLLVLILGLIDCRRDRSFSEYSFTDQERLFFH